MTTPRKPAARKRTPSKAPAKRPAAPARKMGHAPDTVYLFSRDLHGTQLGVTHARHDGTVAGIRAAARRLQGDAEVEHYGWSMAASSMIATDAHGHAGWAISPNLAHINPVGSEGAAYTLGGPVRNPARKRAPRRR